MPKMVSTPVASAAPASQIMKAPGAAISRPASASARMNHAQGVNSSSLTQPIA
ncbi:MAG: hypothetical protein Q7J32_18505 [Sphingomonadaceae bacterium]|nr:hypothetical protein [Sphingomonadaceae bacterium]